MISASSVARIDESIRTDIGVFPSDWRIVELGEIGSFKNGINKDSAAFGHGSPFVNLMDVFGIPSIGSNEHLGLIASTPSEQNFYDLRAGDVLFVRSSVKPSGVALTTTVVSDLPKTVFSGFLIRFRDSGKLAEGFKRHCFSSEYFRKTAIAASSVSANTNISQSALKSLRLAVPSTKAEQKAIAEALSDADALIESLEALIAKKRAIKQGAMQDLLSGRKRIPGFSEEWTTKQLSELCHLKSGDGITSKRIDNFSPYPCYGGNGLRGYTTTYTHDGRFALIGRVGALCGNVNVADGRFFASEHAIVVTASNSTSIDWLALVLDELRLNRLSEASAQPVLTVSKLAKLEIFAPTENAEQTAIASVIGDLNASLLTLEERLTKARQIKQGMMQELLTGRVRLV